MEKEKQKHVQLMLDVEASGQVPGLHDMVSIGLIELTPKLDNSIYAEFAPLHDDYQEGAYATCGITREQHLAMPVPELGMMDLFKWVAALKADRITIWSDNNGYDFAFLNWYVWWMLDEHNRVFPAAHMRVAARSVLGLATTGPIKSPFGHSSRRIGDVAAGLCRNIKATSGWKKKRITRHTHRADDDARGNAEALLHLIQKYEQEPLW